MKIKTHFIKFRNVSFRLISSKKTWIGLGIFLILTFVGLSVRWYLITKRPAKDSVESVSKIYESGDVVSVGFGDKSGDKDLTVRLDIEEYSTTGETLDNTNEQSFFEKVKTGAENFVNPETPQSKPSIGFEFIGAESINGEGDVETVADCETSECNSDLLKNGDIYLAENVVDNIDLSYEVIEDKGIKENITIKEKTENLANVYEFELLIDDSIVDVHQSLTKSSLNPDGTYYFTDKNGTYVAHIEPPFAIDSHDQKTYDVDLEINNNRIKLTVDNEWLNSEDRVFPITIDPTVVHDTQSEFASGSLNRLKDIGSGDSDPVVTMYNQAIPNSYSGLVGLWRMDNNWNDSSGNGNNGTANGGVTFSTVSKLGSHAGSFDGSDDYINLGSGSSLDDISNLTVEAWIKLAGWGESGYGRIYEKGAGTTAAKMFYVYESGNQLAFYQEFSGDYGFWITPTNSLSLNTWYHVAVKYNSSSINNDPVMYINGVRQIVTESVTPSGSAISDSTNNARIGSDDATTRTFNGLIDEVAVYNRFLSDDEISRHAQNRPSASYISPVIDLTSVNSWTDLAWTENGVTTGDGETPYSTTGLVAQWNFNETSGTTANNDAEGSSCGGTPANCDGTLTNFASTGSQDAAVGSGWTSDNRRWGAGALMFDGSNDYVHVGDNNALDFGTGDFTITAWLKFDSPSYLVLVSKVNSTANSGFSFRSGGGYLELVLDDNAAYKVVGEKYVSDGTWHYVVSQRAGDNLNLYVDGTLDASISGVDDIDISGTENLNIGRREVAENGYLKSIFDSVSIYNRALSADEILSNYNASNIQFQTRVGDTSTPDASWEAWSPNSNETSISGFESGTVGWNASDSISAITSSYNFSNSYTLPTAPTGCSSSKRLVAINPSSSALTDYQILFNVDYESGMSSDFSNLRFTNSSGTDLDYWIEDYTSSTDADVWLEVDAIAANSFSDVYMWYDSCTGGNSSNAENTFELYDNFDDNSIDTSKWQTSIPYTGGSITETSQVMKCYKRGYLYTQDEYTNVRVKYKAMVDNSEQIVNAFGRSDAVATGTYKEVSNAIGMSLSAGSTSLNSRKRVAGVATTFSDSSYTRGTTWHDYGFTLFGDSEDIRLERFWDTNSYVDENLTFESSTNEYVHFYCREAAVGYAYYDDIIIAKYAYPEPYVDFVEDSIGAVAEGSSSSVLVQSSIPIDDDTVGLWDFNETNGDLSGDDIFDLTDNNNDLEIETGTSVVDGIEGKARYFDGNDYIYMPISAIPAGDEITISYWVYGDSVYSTSTQLLYAELSGNRVLNIHHPFSSNIMYWDAGDETSSYDRINKTITENDVQGSWVHWAFTKNANSGIESMKIYKNGELWHYGTGKTLSIGTPDFVFLGGSWKGSMDLLRIDSVERSAEEIAEMYRLGANKRYTQDITSTDLSSKLNLPVYIASDAVGVPIELTVGESDYTNYEPDDNTLGFWHLDEPIYSDLENDVIKFTSTNIAAANSYIYWKTLSASSTLATGDTLEYDVYIANDISAIGGIEVISTTNAAMRDVSGWEDQNGIRCHPGYDISDYAYGKWYHRKCTVPSGANGRVLSYIDLVNEYDSATAITAYYANFELRSSTGALKEAIYTDGSPDYNEYHFRSSTSNTADASVSRAALSGITPIGKVEDSSSNGNYGLASGPNSIEGKIGRAMEFNGTSDYVKTTVLSSSMSAFTLEAWFKTEATSGWGYIVGSHPSREGSFLSLNGTNNTGLRFSADLGGEVSVDSTSNVRDGKWHYAVGTYDGSAMRLYIDGVLESVNSSVSGSQPGFISYLGSNNVASDYFAGSIDEVRISDVARSADDIRQAYEYGRRSYAVTIDFVSSLSAADVKGTSESNALTDVSFVIADDGMINNIFNSERVIIRENYGGSEYLVQGEVTGVNTGTRTITVDSLAGNVPNAGTGVCGGSDTHCFTSNATVFKWQREYFDITSPLDEDINGIQRVSIRLLDGSIGRTLWLDGLYSAGSYLTNPAGSTITSSDTNQYFQYRAIYTTNDLNVSASIEDVTLDYDNAIAPVNTSLTLTNPFGGDGNDLISDNSTEWNFRAVIDDEEGYTDLNTVVLRLADNSDNSAPYEDLEFTWTQSDDSFAETGTDANSAATLMSDSGDTTCSGNQCTIDFKIKINTSFTTSETNYNGALLTTDDSTLTDSDTYTDLYQVIVDSPAVNESLTLTNPYGGSGNTIFADGSTEYTFSAVVSDPDGYSNLTSVELALADATDSSVPYDDIQFVWTESTDSFSEPVNDSNSAVSISSTSTDSTCSGNQCTLNFKLIFNSNFTTVLTDYSAQLITTGYGDDVDTDSYSNIYNVEIGYTVNNVVSGYSVLKTSDWTTDLSSTRYLGETEIGIQSSNNIRIAKFNVDLDEDLDWSDLTVSTDTSENKALLHIEGGITSIPGVTSSDYSLYVPKGSGDKVGICPNATSTDEVNASCDGFIVKSTLDSDVSVVTEDGIEYWLISGLTGTGAYSTTVTPVGDSQAQNFMHAQIINGETYIAIATEAGVSITNESDGSSVNSSYTDEVYQAIISKDGHLYYSTEAGDVKVVYNIENLSNNFSEDISYTSSSTPAILYSSGEINDLAVVDGVSFVDGKSNVIYVATNDGLSIVNECQVNEDEGSVKYFNTERVTEDLIGEVRGMWGFDDNASSTAIDDVSVNGNDLTASVNTDTIDTSAVRVKGLTLSSDYATRADDSDFDFSETEDFSISVWAKHGTIATSSDYLLTKSEAGTNGGYQLYMDSDGDFVFALDDDSTWSPDDSVGGSLSNNYDDDNWHHLVAIKENTESIKLYVDNVLVDSDSAISATSTLANDDAFYVGVDDTGAANYWDGEIDELMISAEAFSETDVEKLYLTGKRSLQNHTANKVPGIGADEYQQLTGSVDLVSALSVDSGNQFVFVGTNDTTSDSGSLSVLGLGSDSLADYFSSSNSLKFSDSVSGIASTDNDIISLSISGNPYLEGSNSLLAFAYSDEDNDSDASKLWIQSSDISLNGALEQMYSDTLTVNNLQTNELQLTNPSGGSNGGLVAGSILATSTGDIQINSTSDSSVNIGDESTRNDLNISGDLELLGSSKIRELTNIADVYIYDTTGDIDGGAWRFGSAAKASSWYNEALDDSFDNVCNSFTTETTGDDRCGSKEFPMIAYLVVTDDALYIFDSKRNVPWMRFDQGGTDNSDRNMIGISSSVITSVRALDGNIYVTGTDNCYSISFTQDKSYTTWNRLVWYNGNISERNAGVGESS